MDDIQKMIERYKKELMEIGRARAQSARPPMIIGDDGEKLEKALGRLSDDSDREGCLKSPVQASSEQALPEQISSEQASPEQVSPEQVSPEPDSAEEDDFSGRIFLPNFNNPDNSEDIDGEINELAPRRVSPESEYGGDPDKPCECPENDGTDRETDGGESDNSPGALPEGAESQGSRTDTDNRFGEPVYESYEEFAAENAGEGSLLFRVYAAREAFPVKGAEIVVTKIIGGKPHAFYSISTDESGQTKAERLPAPSKELSLESGNEIQPFALYDAEVKSDGYAAVELKGIPVFDGVSSIQRVAMIPAGEQEAYEDITEVR